MCRTRSTAQGFTLIELLVSLAVMALLALMSWRGVAGMVSAQTLLRERVDGVASLQVGLRQWSADLNAVMETGVVEGVSYDGRVLRLTRYDTGTEGSPLRVVGWTRRVVAVEGEAGAQGRWTRWQSPPIETREELQSAWARAQQWAQNAGAQPQPGEVAVVLLAGWQIFYFRNNAWSHPLSSADAVVGMAPVPEGIRLVLDLSAGQPVTGLLTRDWIRPVVNRARS